MSGVLTRLARLTTPVDLAVAGALMVVGAVESLGNHDAVHPGIRAAFAVVAAGSVALRRRLPTTAAAIFSAAMVLESAITESPDETAVLLACLLISYSVTANAPAREALLGTGLISLALSFAIGTDPSDSVSNIPPTLVLFVGLPAVLGLTMRRRQERITALTLETEALAREADRAVEAERRRLARELHDVVSHAVTLIAVQAEAGQAVLAEDPGAAR